MISSALEFLVLLPLLLLTGVGLYPTILLFPLIHVMFFLAVYGLGLILASFYVYYRDLNQIWEVAIQAGFFVCPIVYAISFIPDKYQFIYSLNPIVRLMDMYRDIFLYGILPVPGDYIVALLWGALLIIIGSITFSRLSRRFAEAV
jgi:lipopolysaccharide transport system permease protein